MQEIFAWLAAGLLTVTVFFAGFSSKKECISKRNIKQDMNLAGKTLTSFCSETDGKIKADEAGFTEYAAKIIGDECFCGAVFVYTDSVIGVSRYGEIFEKEIDTGKRNDAEYVSNLAGKTAGDVCSSVRGKEIVLRIECGTESEGDEPGERNMLYSTIPENGLTVFLVSKGEKYTVVSGFTIE